MAAIRRLTFADLARDWSEANEIEGEVSQDSDVVRGMFGTGPHLIIVKDDQTIFDLPMGTHGLIQSGGIWGQAGEVEALLSGGFTV